jgi:hypothetical protein
MTASTTISNHPWWTCFLCFPDVVEIGMIAPGFALTRSKGKYKILGGQGHRGDYIYTFKRKPIWDPYYSVWYLSDEEQDIFFDNEVGLPNSWTEDHMSVVWGNFQLPISEAHYFYEACVRVGYDPPFEQLASWVINKCALLIDMYNLGIRDTDTEAYDLSDT